MRILLAALAVLVLGGRAVAADLSVVVQGMDGKPVQDAVASFAPAGGAPPGPIKFPWPMQVAQENLQFSPFVLIVPEGADVVFPNHDNVRHHVYSFSSVKRFELKLYGKEEARTVKFEKAGTVALGCNIHDQMVGFIRVVDTPYAGKTDAGGKVTLKGVPAGGGTLTIWQPYIHTPQNEVTRKLSAVGAAPEAFTVEMRVAAARR